MSMAIGQNITSVDYKLQLVLSAFFAIIGGLAVAYPKKPSLQSTSSKNLQ